MKLLVSVRSADEALAALEGGADLIDVKEPSRGSLGRADDAVIEAVIRAVDGRAPVSAAMGELRDAGACRIPDLPLAYLKWGLAGCEGLPWRERLLELRESTEAVVVPCAYADKVRAEAPDWEAVAGFVLASRYPVMLFDTFMKDGSGLFDWLPLTAAKETVAELHEVSSAVALAGSLRLRDVAQSKTIGADWMAVRGAVCASGERDGALSTDLVKGIRILIDAFGGGRASFDSGRVGGAIAEPTA